MLQGPSESVVVSRREVELMERHGEMRRAYHEAQITAVVGEMKLAQLQVAMLRAWCALEEHRVVTG